MTVDTSAYPRRSRFVYGASGDETDVTFDLPTRPWGRRAPTVGGSKTSAAGVPASYIVRRDEVIVLPMRVRETEWAKIRALVAWGQAAETLEWFPDALDFDTSYDVYLEAPKAGEDFAPTRATEYPRMMEATIELRLVTPGTVFEEDFYADA